jgi:ComF family protein
MLTHFSNTAAAWLLAPRCVSCRTRLVRPLADPLCDICWKLVRVPSPPWCERCGDVLLWTDVASEPVCARCREHPPSFSTVRSGALFEGPIRELIHTFKYERRRGLSRVLARLMREAGAMLLEDADAAVPVPLHPVRAFRRGFNQADDLACGLGLPVWRALSRGRGGRTQASLGAHDRRVNLAGAFGPALTWRLHQKRRDGLRDRTIVLVDDVMTTGATADACAAVLLDLGVRTVRVLTAARAAAGPPPRLRLPHPTSILPRR